MARMTALAAGILACTISFAADAARCTPPQGPTGNPLWVVVTKAKLGQNGLRIVTFGSSSTAGVGASSPTASYPAQLERLLAARLPERSVEVVNKGVGGETVADNLKRLGRDVLALKPELVVWQVGTNDALRGLPPAVVARQVEGGLARLRAAGIPVVLMDPQPLPAPDAERKMAAMADEIAAVAHRTHTPLFSRHELLQRWLEAGAFTSATLYVGDGLHMGDAGYRCLAESLASSLLPERPLLNAEAAPPPAVGS